MLAAVAGTAWTQTSNTAILNHVNTQNLDGSYTYGYEVGMVECLPVGQTSVIRE